MKIDNIEKKNKKVMAIELTNNININIVKKVNILILFFIFIILSLSLVSAQQNLGYNGCFGMMSGSYGFGAGMIFGWVFMILVIVALVLLIIWLVRQLTHDNRRRR